MEAPYGHILDSTLPVLALRSPPGSCFPSIQPLSVLLPLKTLMKVRDVAIKVRTAPPPRSAPPPSSLSCPGSVSPRCVLGLRSGLNTLSSISLLLSCSVPPAEVNHRVEEPSRASRCRCHVTAGKKCEWRAFIRGSCSLPQ